jgi:hypothetical protein
MNNLVILLGFAEGEHEKAEAQEGASTIQEEVAGHALSSYRL